MGNLPAKETDSFISRRLKSVAKRDKRTIKILLLGSGDSGKTTIYKQLLNSKGNGFTTNSLNTQAKGLILNLLEGTLNLVQGAADEKKEVSQIQGPISVLREAYKTLIGQFEVKIELTKDMVEAVKKIWADDVIQSIYSLCMQSGKYHISDNYVVLIEKLDLFPAWGGKNWVPSVDDCMLLRSPTTGMSEQTFVQGNTYFQLIDVGGQRSERRKWIHLFDGLAAVIYVCSMSEYDQTLYEADDVNRLEESRTLFKSIAESRFFRDSAIIIYFNKMDLFYEKYKEQRIPLNFSGLFENAPLYDENDSECVRAKEWYLNLLTGSLDQPEAVNKKYHHHYTTALDTAQMEEVINDTAAHLLRNKLLLSGFSKDI